MGIEVFTNAEIPVIVGICAIVGWLIKRVDNDRLHDFIPTIVCVLGLALAIINANMNGDVITLEVIFAGMASGLASTGCYEMVLHWIDSHE